MAFCLNADESFRRQVRGFRLTPNGGSSRWIATSWGPAGGNQLKGKGGWAVIKECTLRMISFPGV